MSNSFSSIKSYSFEGKKKIVIAYSSNIFFIQKGINTLVKMKFKRLIETCNVIKGKSRSTKLYVF